MSIAYGTSLRRFVLFGGFLALVSGGGCGTKATYDDDDDSSGGTSSGPKQGELGGPCGAGDECDPGLECVKATCAMPAGPTDNGGQGGTGGSRGGAGGVGAAAGTASQLGGSSGSTLTSGAGGTADIGGSAGEGGALGGAGGTTSQTPTGVLVYHGDGGVEEDVLGDGSVSYRGWADLAGDAQVSFTDEWPSSLDSYRTIMLVAPGAADPAEFTEEHQDLLADWVRRGGTLVLLSDYGHDLYDYSLWASNDTIEAFLARLSIPITVSGDLLVGGSKLTLTPSHPLAKGLTTITCPGGFGQIGVDAPAEEAGTVLGESVLATAELGDGHVIVLDDLDCVSDYRPDADSEQLVRNILAY